jgi:hypothetical protein
MTDEPNTTPPPSIKEALAMIEAGQARRAVMAAEVMRGVEEMHRLAQKMREADPRQV